MAAPVSVYRDWLSNFIAVEPQTKINNVSGYGVRNLRVGRRIRALRVTFDVCGFRKF